MKRLMTALAPTLMTGALLGIGAASQAQSNVISITGDLPDFLEQGRTYTLDIRATMANQDADATTVQSVLFMNRPSVFSNVSWEFAFAEGTRVNNFTPRTATIAGGEYAGVHTMFSSTLGFIGIPDIVFNNTLIGTYSFTVAADAGGFVDLGLAQSAVAGNGVIQDSNLSSTFRSIITTNPTTTAGTIFQGGNAALGRNGGFRVAVVPGPSSLAVFALGGLVPVIGLVRRRRAGK